MTTQAQDRGLGAFARRGFSLEYEGNETIRLLHEGELLARFSQTGATEESLDVECTRHLIMKHGWDGCLQERS